MKLSFHPQGPKKLENQKNIEPNIKIEEIVKGFFHKVYIFIYEKFGCGENKRQSSETLDVTAPIALKP